MKVATNVSDLKERFQQFFTDGLLIVVGSGLSCAEGLPGMMALGEHLANTVDRHLTDDDRAVWHDVLPKIQSDGLEPTLLKVDLSPRLESAIAHETASLITRREREVINEVFTDTRVLAITRLVPHLLKPNTGIPIITTNYDRLVEIGVEEAGLGADTMFAGRMVGRLDELESSASFCRNVSYSRSLKRAKLDFRCRARIFKPHGSLDWYVRRDKPTCYQGDGVDAARLLITPGRSKFRNGYDAPFDLHRERANAAIDRASRLLIVGYGFNDDHLETHLMPRLRSGIPVLAITQRLSPSIVSLTSSQKNFMSLDEADAGSGPGTRCFIDGEGCLIPDVMWWKLDHFIAEVLEP